MTPEDLREHPLILQYEGYDTEMVLYLKQNGFTISSEYRIEVDAACHSYVEKGLGFCLAARMTLDCNPADVGVWPLVPEWERVLKACHAAGKPCYILSMTPPEASALLNAGYDGVAHNLDFNLLIEAYQRHVTEIREGLR